VKSSKIISILALVILIGFAYGSANIAFKNFKLSDDKNAYLGNLTWYKDLAYGMELAQQENKPILVYFWAVWCQFCEKFETETLPNPEVRNLLLNDFILVAVDLDEDRDTPRMFGVSYPPYELFLDADGNVIESVPGFVPPERFLPILKSVKEKYRRK